MRALYREHDAFVMPSHFEGFGIALVEALAHGLPCVARAAFAMPEIVEDGINGTLVWTTRPAELAEAIAKVLADDQLHATTMARVPDVLGHYTWDRAAAQLLEVARTVV